MKAILTIAGNSYLLPAKTDLAKLLEIFQGVVPVDSESAYGPEGARYDEPYRFERMVTEDKAAKVRVELVDERDVVSRQEWNELMTGHGEACAKFIEKRSAVGAAAVAAIKLA